MPNVARNCFCAPANTFLNSRPLEPSTAKRQQLLVPGLAVFNTLIPNTVSPDRCSRILAGKSVTYKAFDKLAGFVSLSPLSHPLVAVAVNIVEYIRMIILHILVIILWDGLLSVSPTVPSRTGEIQDPPGVFAAVARAWWGGSWVERIVGGKDRGWKGSWVEASTRCRGRICR